MNSGSGPGEETGCLGGRDGWPVWEGLASGRVLRKTEGGPPGLGREGSGGCSSSLGGDMGRGVRWEGEIVPLPLPSSVLSDESRAYLCFSSFTDCLIPTIFLPVCGLLSNSMVFLSGLRTERSEGA